MYLTFSPLLNFTKSIPCFFHICNHFPSLPFPLYPPQLCKSPVPFPFLRFLSAAGKGEQYFLRRQSRDAFNGAEIHWLRRLRLEGFPESLSRSCQLVRRSVVSSSQEVLLPLPGVPLAKHKKRNHTLQKHGSFHIYQFVIVFSVSLSNT